jgi:hypothetical protein
MRTVPKAEGYGFARRRKRRLRAIAQGRTRPSSTRTRGSRYVPTTAGAPEREGRLAAKRRNRFQVIDEARWALRLFDPPQGAVRDAALAARGLEAPPATALEFHPRGSYRVVAGASRSCRLYSGPVSGVTGRPQHRCGARPSGRAAQAAPSATGMASSVDRIAARPLDRPEHVAPSLYCISLAIHRSR